MAYRRGTVDAVFLLDAGVVTYLEQLRERAVRALFLRKKIEAHCSVATVDLGYHCHVDESAKIETWFLKQFDVLLSKFKPFDPSERTVTCYDEWQAF